MAKPRLKVFRAQMGFVESVVAAPSQKAALEAWGARQNLFAEGLAIVTDEPVAVSAATAKPGVVLQRPVGATTAFTEELVGRPAAPPAEPRPAGAKPAATAKPPPKPKPDRFRLTAAEAALAAVEDEAKAALAELDRRRKQMDEEAARVQARLDAKREAAQRKLEDARRAFESG